MSIEKEFMVWAGSTWLRVAFAAVQWELKGSFTVWNRKGERAGCCKNFQVMKSLMQKMEGRVLNYIQGGLTSTTSTEPSPFNSNPFLPNTYLRFFEKMLLLEMCFIMKLLFILIRMSLGMFQLVLIFLACVWNNKQNTVGAKISILLYV